MGGTEFETLSSAKWGYSIRTSYLAFLSIFFPNKNKIIVIVIVKVVMKINLVIIIIDNDNSYDNNNEKNKNNNDNNGNIVNIYRVSVQCY